MPGQNGEPNMVTVGGGITCGCTSRSGYGNGGRVGRDGWLFTMTTVRPGHQVHRNAGSAAYPMILDNRPYSALLISSLSWRSLIASMVRRSCSAIWLCGVL